MNKSQKEGKSTLILAANWEQQNSEVISALIRKGANVNGADLQGSFLIQFDFHDDDTQLLL